MLRYPLACFALLALLSGCGDDGADVRGSSNSASNSNSHSNSNSNSAAGECPTAATADANVEVVLREFEVVPSAAGASAGRISFLAKNQGEDVHELVVVKADSPAALPTISAGGELTNGTVDETKLPAGSFVGEIEGVPAGKTCAGSFALQPGRYVLFCNIAEKHDDKVENHFQLGMRTALTVQ
jgi:hypothetical protein